MNIVGEIKLFAGEFIPPGFMECDGSALPIPLYKQLFAVIGYTYTDYGSNGQTKYFNLPSGGGIFPGSKWIICVEGYFPRSLKDEIYSSSTGTLMDDAWYDPSKRKIDYKFTDPKSKEKIDYEPGYWARYDVNTDRFSDR